MLRVMRLKSSDLAPMWEQAAQGLPDLINSLGLPAEARSLIAARDVDGEYINYHSVYDGSLEQVPIYQCKPLFPKNRFQAQINFIERRDLILKRLEPILAQEAANTASTNPKSKVSSAHAATGAGAVASKDAQGAGAAIASGLGGAGTGGLGGAGGAGGVGAAPSPAQMLKTLLMYPQHLIILNETMPVIVPCFDAKHVEEVAAAEAAAAAAAAGTGAVAANSHRGCIVGLILLLLLALAAAWYFWKLWPWPFVDEAELAKQQELAALEQSLADDEALLAQIDNLIDKTDLRLELAGEINRGDELAKLQEDLAKDQANLAEIEKLIAQVDTNIDRAQKAEEEAKRAAEEAAAKAAEGAKKTVAKDDHADVNVASAKKLPKCSYIKKQGKIPQLVIATDGSGSMLNAMSDRTIRIDAAIKAAHSLIDNVDKNVPIRLFGIQGCPLARDYGVFGSGQRAALKRAVSNTDPRLVRGMQPFEVLTPLVSALRGMANSVPANVDSVGILISDGVDTCLGTEDLNLCTVAREIHAMRPKLKINVVLIGDDAEEAKCIAHITGGKLYRPSDSMALKLDLKNAGSTLQKVCE